MTHADVVVIGAGSAGCVLANRLSASPDRTVLLLEAGPDHAAGRDGEAPDTGDSGVAGPSFFDALEVPGRTWPELAARRRPEHEPVVYRRGRGVGGSSAVNAMVAIPGHPDDYDRWEALGATGWGWRDVAPWFGSTALTMRPAPRAEQGPVTRTLCDLLPSNVESIPLTRDRLGRRVSSADAYLDPIRDRANLTIRGDSPVARVLTDGPRTVGVQLTSGEEIESPLVIVSAGAIHSPALLLVSGIERPGIGRNLKDHPAIPIPIEYHEDLAPDPYSLPISAIGRFSSGEIPDDVQWLPLDHLGPSAPGLGMVMVALMQVRSTGRVTVTCGDSPASPQIDFNLLEDADDLARLTRGAAHAIEVLSSSDEIARLGRLIVPDLTPAGLRAALGDYVHAVGTCRMGALDDSNAVVDPAGRVIGYDGLMVCDASVMPDLPRANTHLPTVMIAERMAASLLRRLSVPRDGAVFRPEAG